MSQAPRSADSSKRSSSARVPLAREATSCTDTVDWFAAAAARSSRAAETQARSHQAYSGSAGGLGAAAAASAPENPLCKFPAALATSASFAQAPAHAGGSAATWSPSSQTRSTRSGHSWACADGENSTAADGEQHYTLIVRELENCTRFVISRDAAAQERRASGAHRQVTWRLHLPSQSRAWLAVESPRAPLPRSPQLLLLLLPVSSLASPPTCQAQACSSAKKSDARAWHADIYI